MAIIGSNFGDFKEGNILRLPTDNIGFYVVARGEIEPPTHGFSVLWPLVISVTYPRKPCVQLRTNNKIAYKLRTKTITEKGEKWKKSGSPI